MSIRKHTRKSRSLRQKLSPYRFERLEPRNLLATLLPGTDPGNNLGNDIAIVESIVDTVADSGDKFCFSTLMTTGVVGRHVFYNGSTFDSDDLSANVEDDKAIASDKSAFFPGEIATFDNYTSFIGGINGIIVDAFLEDAAGFSSNDIVLSNGIGNELSDYQRISQTPEISVRTGEGLNGSDRITIVIPNGSVVNEYLQVNIRANAIAGLDIDDVFYFGNIIGETGDSQVDTDVNLLDVSLARANQTGFSAATVDNQWDINRDGRVNLLDVAIVRSNQTGFSSIPLVTAPLLGIDYFVASAQEIDDILSMLQPGDTITMENGIWNNQEIDFSAMGTADRPITLRAESPGQVILNGSSSLNISGDWLVVDGLNFVGGSLGENEHIVEFRGDLGEANNSRFTNSAITNYNPSNINTRYFWVSLYGQNNRVDHNDFSGQNHSGVTVTVWRDSADPDFHFIDNNHFSNRPEGNDNGFETIRIGTSAESLSDSFTTVESNLFEGIDGEIEIISNKSGSNIFRNNTFRESSGTLTLRHGDNNLVEGNFFLGGEKVGSGGVRVIGENQTIVNNYFEGLDGRAGAAISISAGVPNSAINGYYQVKNAIIAHNTIVSVKEAAILFDHGVGSSGRTLLAENVTIANNLISSSLDPLFAGDEGSSWTWEGNIAFGASLGPKAGDTGITVVDPQLVLDAEGLWRPDSNSDAIDGSSGDYSVVTGGIDIDGQHRDGLFDIGADEYSVDSIVRGALIAADVGNYWSVDDGGSSDDCSCLTINSDEFTTALDPNGDGDTWTVATRNDALGGMTMIAPIGNTVNLPGTHDAILTYDLQFPEAGTYTAYYRGSGANGSSNSMYTPDGFGTDPDLNESLSSNGVYRWETGGTFEVTSSDVGGTLEFRIGKRESGADFDAFVFHFDADLTDSELDALFG